jgi:RNA polymerase sigma-54 factor
MKQSLQLRMGQHLAMTPQLQQAIKLLQLSSVDLQQEIQDVLDSNMMLETVDEESGEGPAADLPGGITSSSDDQDYRELRDMDTVKEIPQELAVDVSWDELYDSLSIAQSSGQFGGENDEYPFQRATGQTLHESLVWQMEMSRFSDRDYAIATTLIDSINQDGYLGTALAEVHQGLCQQIPALELDEVTAVLHRLQTFEPAGIAALDLADCLRIQLSQLPDSTPRKALALKLVSQHLDLLAKKDVTGLKRKLDLDDESLGEVINLVRSLEPKPGQQIAADDSHYITPDVFVIRQADHWTVALNPEIAPRLRVNPFYSGMVKRADASTENTSMRNHLQEARWFIKSLQSRNETLLKVAKSIIERQQTFLNEGEKAMKPLVLRDIAEEVGMHESTISRVTTQKYMHTPNGIFEFKYFFSSHVSTKGGGECSATAIKAYLKDIISTEDAHRPLSDEAIAKILQGRGINVARRTIAKYREAMAIAPSSERKRIF